ncbi:acetyl esterase [Xylaria sp. FL1777]|nr:acetyl esterase [Xylaria sp. FL1777]
MLLTGDIVINYSRLDPNNTTEDAKKHGDFLEKATNAVPRWYEVGAVRYREMIEAGDVGGLKPVNLAEAQEINIPSREPGRDIPVRVYKLDNGEASKGILLHIHGGGYTIGSHRHIDGLLKFYANTCQVTALSAGYRLAPEHPWPAGCEDCIDVAEHLADGGGAAYGGKLLFLAGESSGANLAILTAFELLRSRPAHVPRGLVLPYGNYSIAPGLPSMESTSWTCTRRGGRRNPLASPLFEDLRGLAESTPDKKLPPALFMVGTNDPVLDDTLLMGVKWLASGSEAIVKIFPGGSARV